MHCDGKCYLKKKINPKADAAPVEQKSESLPIQKGLDLAEVILRPELPVWHFVSAVQVLVPTEKTLLVQCLQRTVFRPPVFTT